MSYDYTQPAANVKCILFTILLASGYWFLPPRNKYVLLGLAYFPYLALAWYDYIYACKHNFGPTYLANFYAWAKPQRSRQIKTYDNWAPEIRNKVFWVDVLVATALVALAPLFLAWNPEKMTTDEERNANIVAAWSFAAVVLIFLYLRSTY